MRIIDINVNEQGKALYRKEGGGNEWRDLGEEGKEQVLTEAQILELSELIVKIENHYGFPCDIEWAYEDGKFYIVQSRPITTLAIKQRAEEDFPINPECEIFRWGPITARYFYIADFLYAITLGYAKEYDDHFWPKALAVFHSNDFVWIHDFNELRKVGGAVFKKHVMNDEDYKKRKIAYSKAISRLHEQETKIEQNCSQLTTDYGLADLMKETNEVIVGVWLPTLSAEVGNYGSIEILRDKISFFVSDISAVDEIIRVLTTSGKLTFYQQEEIDLQETDNLREHQQNYFWLHNSFAGVEYLNEDFFRKRKNELQPNLREEHEKRAETVSKEKELIIKKYNLTKSIVIMAERILDAIEWQDERKKHIWILQHYKHLLIDEVKRRTGRGDLERFGLLDLSEIVVGKEQSRAENFGFICDNGKIYELDENTAEKYWDVYAHEKVTDTKNIKGIIANTGKVIGHARIVRDPKDKNIIFNEGDILIASMTSPDYIFLMKKSSAIITDTGGLTSHAAIISRELKKPCIIGTKIATQVLHDGDLVEVDADNGVVRIIEKAK